MATLREALFPRLTAAQATGAPWYSPKVGLASILDQASLPGRAYVSLGRPEGETYSDAVARTEPRMDLAGYQGEGDEFAETVLRDPSLPLGAIGGAIRGLGRVGRAVVDASIGGATGAADQYSQGRDVSLGALLAGAGMSIVPSVAMGGRKNPVSRMAEEITPEQRAANFKNWFGDSKVVDEAGNPLTVYHGGGSLIDDFSRGPYRGDLGAAYFSDSPRTAMQYAIAGGSPQRGETLHELLRMMKQKIPDRTPTITKANLSIKNPFDITSKNAFSAIFDTYSPEEIQKMTRGTWVGDHLDRIRDDYELDSFDDVIQYARENSHEFYAPTGSKDDLAVGESPAFTFLATTGKIDDFLNRRKYDGLIFDDNETGTKTFVPRSATQIKSATGNRGTFDPNDPNITHFAGNTLNGPSVSASASNRVKRAASEAGLRKYLSDDERMQVGGPVRTTLGGLLMSSPGDTYYTRRAR